MEKKLTFEFLEERGFLSICVIGADTVFEKWGLSVYVHMNFISCVARIPKVNEIPINYQSELLEIERLLNIDNTPILTKMGIDELKSMIPEGYTYILDEKKPYVKSERGLSFSTAMGRYKIKKGREVIISGYNDEREDYFLKRSVLYLLGIEKMMPVNPLRRKTLRNTG
jgi:hypothetical protein